MVSQRFGLRPPRARPVDPKPIRYPSAARLAYLQGLTQIVAVIEDAIGAVVIVELPRILQAHGVTRPVRIDNAGDEIGRAFAGAATAVDRHVTPRRVELLAQQNAVRVANHNAAEVSAQIKSVVGIDLTAPDTGLGPHLDAFVAQNVALVKSLKDEALAQAHSIVLQGVRQGLRHQEVAKQLRASLGLTKSRAALIATDQVGKLNGELTQLRQTSLGIRRYKWSTSADERVRPGHRALNGSIQQWDKPPIENPKRGTRGHPGFPVRCRCSAIPIVDDLLAAAGLPTTGQAEVLPDVLPGLPQLPAANAPPEVPTPAPPKRRRQPLR